MAGGHLKYGDNGHLLYSASGHLVNDCGVSSDCVDCEENCCEDGTIPTLVVSGFTGTCSALNQTYTNVLGFDCGDGCSAVLTGVTDSQVGGWVYCDAGGWHIRLLKETGGPMGVNLRAACYPCALTCNNGTNPTGSGTLVGSNDCNGQTGSFSLS